jgi:hypothetical protein
MNWTRESEELPPNYDYSGMTQQSRDVMVYLVMREIRAEFSLYERTRNGAHLWRCYQLWRRLMPDDLPLPNELLVYFDECATAVANETDPEILKREMGLTKRPGRMADHGGGPSGAAAAKPTRRQQNAMQFVRSELFRARIQGDTPRGYKTEIYEEAAEKFSFSVSHIKRLLHDWSVSEAVEWDLKEWRTNPIVSTTLRD